MEKKLNALDLGPYDYVTLETGESFPVHRLTNIKLIKIAKFIGIDGMKLYEQFKDVIGDESLSETEKWITILESLPEETLVHLLSIMLEIEDEESLAIDPVTTLEIIEVYADNINIEKAFTSVRNIAKKVLKVDIPDLNSLLSKIPVNNGKDLSTNLSTASN